MSLRLVAGGVGPLHIGDVELHVVRDDEALPFGVDVIVVEEDTWLSLAPPKDVLPESAGAGEVVRTMTRAHDVEPLPLGSAHLSRVAVGRTGAVIAKAIVIDVDDEPCCVPASVTAAMRAILDECRARKLDALRVPLLGSLRGHLSAHDSARAIALALAPGPDVRGGGDGTAKTQRMRIALVVPAADERDVRDEFIRQRSSSRP